PSSARSRPSSGTRGCELRNLSGWCRPAAVCFPTIFWPRFEPTGELSASLSSVNRRVEALGDLHTSPPVGRFLPSPPGAPVPLQKTGLLPPEVDYRNGGTSSRPATRSSRMPDRSPIGETPGFQAQPICTAAYPAVLRPLSAGRWQLLSR